MDTTEERPWERKRRRERTRTTVLAHLSNCQLRLAEAEAEIKAVLQLRIDNLSYAQLKRLVRLHVDILKLVGTVSQLDSDIEVIS